MTTGTTSEQPAVERVHPPDWIFNTIVNPTMRFLLRRGKPAKVAEELVVLHFRGRRSGKPYEVPVRMTTIRGRRANLTSSGWRANFRGGRDLEATWRGERHPAHATLTEAPDEVAAVYDELIGEVGLDRAGRELGIRINVDRRPTLDELREMVERSGLSILWIDIDAA